MHLLSSTWLPLSESVTKNAPGSWSRRARRELGSAFTLSYGRPQLFRTSRQILSPRCLAPSRRDRHLIRIISGGCASDHHKAPCTKQSSEVHKSHADRHCRCAGLQDPPNTQKTDPRNLHRTWHGPSCENLTSRPHAGSVTAGSAEFQMQFPWVYGNCACSCAPASV